MDSDYKVITKEDGKDYLVSFVVKEDNHEINALPLFTHVREMLDLILQRSNAKFGTKSVYIKEGYGAELQSLWSRFSGDYFSPSFLKGYETNPALNLVQTFFKEGANDATAIGTLYHACMEQYYMQKPEDRQRYQLYDFEKQLIGKDQDIEKVHPYIEGYINIKDYLHPKKDLDDTKLECKTEHRGRATNLHVPRLGYTVPCAVSYVADRIDYRGDDIVILDYKTGSYRPEHSTFDGYLGSMILYKWAMEQELNVEITKGYLIHPGEKTKKYHQMDYSRENEEIMAEKIDKFYKQFIRDVRTRIYAYTDLGYFTTDDAKLFREQMNNNAIWRSKKYLEICLGDHTDTVLDQGMFEK